MEQFGRYQLLRKLGTGGMAEVYLARTPLAQGLQKLLVIKKIHPAYASTAQFRVMFRHEAEAAMNLNHPNIVQVFEWGELPAYYLSMEYVEGVDLMRLIAAANHAGRRFAYGLAAYVVQQMAKGLDYAHRKSDPVTGEALGIVHRDVSPQNILISYDGSVKLVDFGIAALRGAPEEEGVVKGKFAYMSPEQAAGKPVDRRSDIFSAGVVLYELATGRPLFGHLKGDKALESIRLADVPSPRTVDPAVPQELEQIVMTALRRDPTQRYQTARDLHKALTRFFFDLASRDEAVYDSSALAAFCSQVVPTEVRRIAAPTAAPPPVSAGTVSAAPAAAAAEEHDTEVRERKHVVVVEGELQGLGALRRTVGEQRARDALLDFLRVAENVAYKRQAHADRLDEGGFSYIIGLPTATEDDAMRAIRLARDLKEALDGISRDLSPPLTLGIGVMRGIADVTQRKGGFEHQLVGMTAQVVRRLAREAMAGEILVGGGVFRMARSEWNFDEIESIDVPLTETTEAHSGETRTARVYRLRGPKERRERMQATRVVADFGGLVGREAELAILLEAWRETVDRQEARYVAVLGETGLGKRSIVGAFLSQLAPGSALVLRTQGRRAISDTPFALIADLVRDFLAIGDDTDPREARRRIEAALTLLYPGHEHDPEAKEIAGAIATLLGVKLPGLTDVALDPTERRHRIFRAIDHLGDRLSKNLPLVVVVEEMHWADPQSLELLRALVMLRRPLPLFGLATARPDERIREMIHDIPRDVQRTIQLSELPRPEGERLLMARFGNDESARPLVEQILARAGGNPFYQRELLEALIERGVVTAQDGRLIWREREAELQIPSTVEAVVASRLDALPASEKEALLRAAIFGRRIVPADLGSLLGRDVAQDLERLAARNLIDREPKGTYLFHNQIIQEVAYQALPEDERRELHRRAARVLSHKEGARPETDAVLAHHAQAGGEREEAVKRFLQAARAARDVAGNRLAFDHLTRARALLPAEDHARRFEIASEREHILRAWGVRPAALRELHAMRRAAEAMNDKGRLAQTLARMARFDHEVGRASRARRHAAQALELAREAGDRLTEIEALRVDALVLHGIGNSAEALERTAGALELCDQRIPERERLLARASVMRTRGTLLMQTGNFRDAVDAHAEAMVIYRRLGVRRMEAASLNDLGMVSVGLGEYEEALGYYKRSLAIDQEIGNRVALGIKLANIGQACLDLGDFERAERYLRKAIEIHEALGERRETAGAFITLGQVFLRRGEAARAREELDRGLALAVESTNRFQEIRALVYLAFAHLAQGSSGAIELARSATRLAQTAQIPQGEAWGLAVEGLALAAAGQAAEGAERSSQAVALLDSGPHFQDREEILHIHARVVARAGRFGDSATVLRRAWEEVQAKARRVRNAELRQRYLGAPPASEIVREYEKL